MKLIKDLGMIYRTSKSKKKKRYGLYLCTCGRELEREIDVEQLTRECQSCNQLKYGVQYLDKNTKLLSIFNGMKSRCYNKNRTSYKNYGERGIVICNEWLSNFQKFKSWSVSNGYEKHLTIDRIDNDGNYEPSNCRWATRTVQTRNTTKLQRTNTSGFRGVGKHKGRFIARIGINKVNVNLGSFDYPWTAAYAYDAYVLKHSLEHTRNFS